MRRLFPLLFLCVATTACLTDTVVVGDRCAVSLESVAPDPASVGQTVTLTGGPFTTAYDTSVYVGQRRALVLELARTSCNECDSCRDNNGCTECDDCDACDEVCASCEESLLVEVPEVEPGETTVLVFNAYGATTQRKHRHRTHRHRFRRHRHWRHCWRGIRHRRSLSLAEQERLSGILGLARPRR
jgi:hypothetical protein